MRRPWYRHGLALLSIAMLALRAEATEPLGTYLVDTDAISVSGVSSGGYMAQQFHVAHAASVMGAGIFAAGPYYCAGDRAFYSLWIALNTCMNFSDFIPFLGAPEVANSLAATRAAAAAGAIDDPRGLHEDRVYLFSGTLDDTVPQAVVDTLYAYYQAFIPTEHIVYRNDIPAGHAMVTEDYGNANCAVSQTPFLNDCDYDAAGQLLAHLYGPLQPPAVWRKESLLAFAQTEFVDDAKAHSLNAVGHVYVPAVCAKGVRCRLHVAFHGCQQYQQAIGNAFYAWAGYNEWAEANNIIVLYPQTKPLTYGVMPWPNPQGCWDWWGYTGSDYAVQSGVQITAVKAMIDHLSGR